MSFRPYISVDLGWFLLYVTIVLLFDTQQNSHMLFNLHHKQLHCNALIVICFWHVHTVHFILDYTFYTDFANQFLVKFEISCCICSCISTFYFLLYSPMMAINIAETSSCCYCLLYTLCWRNICLFYLIYCINLLRFLPL
jgi:hypothetical protein